MSFVAILKRIVCRFITHKWYPDVVGIRGSGYGVPNEDFCVRCGKLEWEVNGITHIPYAELKPHIIELEAKRQRKNENEF